jgi:hypothetical protein
MSFQAVQGIFEVGSRLLETEHLLNESLNENDRLCDLKKTASSRIQVAERNHKSAEAGLKPTKRQVVELIAKLDRGINHACELRAKISELKAEVKEAREGVQKAEDSALSYYDQGFDEVANSLKSQLTEEYNKYFLQGWRAALDRAGVDDAFELYDLGPKHRPFKVGSPEEHKEEEVVGGPMDPKANEVLRVPEANGQILVVEVQEGDDGSDREDTVDVVN